MSRPQSNILDNSFASDILPVTYLLLIFCITDTAYRADSKDFEGEGEGIIASHYGTATAVREELVGYRLIASC